MNQITFEFYGRLERLANLSEYTLEFAAPITLASALAELAQQKPDIQQNLERCACALGDSLVQRDLLLNDSVRIALLPPVAGG